MKIKSIENLEERIDKDFAWRKKELFQLKMAIEKNNSTLSQKTLVRSAIALLCAHWEGFIRSVANYYIVYICDQKIKNKNLTENFIAFNIKSDFKRSGNSLKNSVHTKLIKKIDSIQEEVFYVKFVDAPSKRIINTNSNLNYELFEEILQSLNIENIYETKKNYIDGEMLKYRHEIVHGENYNDDEYNFSEVYTQVLSIMENFKAQIIAGTESKAYLKQDFIEI